MQKYSNANSYAECVLEFAQTIGDRVALKSPEASCTYAELAEQAGRYAAILRDLGVQRGDRIAILTTPRVDSVVLLIAMNMVGAIWVCLNPQYRLREFQYVIEDAQPSLLFHISGFEGRSYLEDVEALKAQNPCLTEVICLDDGATPGKRFGDLKAVTGRAPFQMEADRDRRFDAAVIVYTSGSSGNPKGAVLPNHGMMERGRGYNKIWPLAEYPIVFDFYPLNHVGGLGWVMGYGLVGGGTVYIEPRFNQETFGVTVRREKINVLQGPPMLYQMLLGKAEFDTADYASVQWLLYSGASMPVELLRRIDDLGWKYSPIYGLTECCGGVTCTYPEGDSLETLATTIGHAIYADEIRIVTPEGRPAKPGEQGEIQVERSRCMLEYFNRPEATAAAFTDDGYFKTGDIAEVGERGYVRFVSRMSEMFKSGGYNIYPREVEAVLEEHPAVGLAAVISLPHPLYAEVGLAYVLPTTESSDPPTGEALRDWCRDRMANYKVPKRIVVASTLPQLPSGKVDKVELKKVAAAELNLEEIR